MRTMLAYISVRFLIARLRDAGAIVFAVTTVICAYIAVTGALWAPTAGARVGMPIFFTTAAICALSVTIFFWRPAEEK